MAGVDYTSIILFSSPNSRNFAASKQDILHSETSGTAS